MKHRLSLTAVAALGAAAMAATTCGGVAHAATTVSPGDHNGPQGTMSAAAVATASTASISGASIIARAEDWYVAPNNPPYSQTAYWASRTDYAGDANGDAPRPGGAVPAWREDCSGFVAHAWDEVDSGGGFTTSTITKYSSVISWSSLEPGDALLFNSVSVPNYGTVAHVGLFMGWSNTAHTSYSVMDESTPGSGSHLQNNIPLGSDHFWQYATPIRYLGYSGPGTSVNTPPPNPGTTNASSGSTTGGYWEVAGNGGVYNYGAPWLGSMGNSTLTKPVVGTTATTNGQGFYEVASDGGIFSFNAPFYGSAGNVNLTKPIVGMAVDPATGGYWMVASDGGVFAYNAPFLGSEGNKPLNQPVVGISATPDGQGYYLVAADGGIFNFGDAHFHGSMGGTPLVKPVVGMTTDPATGGYWMVASDGGVFAFNAPFDGSAGALPLVKPVVGMSVDPTSGGYWLVASDGGIFNYGDAHFAGSAGAVTTLAPVVGIARGPA